jgi:hypothetical protein
MGRAQSRAGDVAAGLILLEEARSHCRRRSALAGGPSRAGPGPDRGSGDRGRLDPRRHFVAVGVPRAGCCPTWHGGTRTSSDSSSRGLAAEFVTRCCARAGLPTCSRRPHRPP